MMEDLLRQWDGECVVVRYDHQTGAWIYIAIHDRTLGMAMGGCRMNVYPSPADGLRDALRLSQGMTYKWAAIGFPFGGGKSVLAVPRRLEGEEREGLLVRFGEILEGLGGAYGGGVDLGTTPEDMNVIGRATSRVFGRTPDHGGAGDPGPWTALGVYSGIRVAVRHILGSQDLDGHTILVQGVGGVGAPLAQRLSDGGARVLVADADEARARRVAEEVEGEVVAAADVYDTECDVYAPCAVGATLNARTIPRLRCRIVAGSANNQLETEEDAERLRERGIVYVPDFVINAGGAIAHGALEMLKWSRERVESRVLQIGDAVREILEIAEQQGVSPLVEAKQRAERVLESVRREREELVAAES